MAKEDNKINLLNPDELKAVANTENSPKQFAMMQLSMKLDKTIKSNFIVDSEEKAIYLLNDYLKDCPNEMLVGIALDSSRKPTCCCVLGMGDEHSIPANIKNVFKFMLTSCADSFILVHSHPNSDNLELSNNDINVINDINNIATKLNIRIRDFIVVGNEKQNRAYYSWVNKQVITQYDFINNLGKNIKNLERPLELDESDPERTIDEVNSLLAESKYNSPDSIADSSNEKSSKGLFGMFK